ncbi:MAG TPA: 16S rRNA (cytidine(1402)-2'-O)-methyltransferase [Anaerolineae bacterium]|nr:16S rRNA (cytidine(1402)-2'-O)-methyltransferase [Anaerolineae bacterium]
MLSVAILACFAALVKTQNTPAFTRPSFVQRRCHSSDNATLCYNNAVGTLYLVATPIGNLEDITLRALRVLSEVDTIAAEDTRHTRKLLSHYQIRTPLLSYHEHNKETRKDEILQALAGGDVALVSDAGMPGLSDPGYELVQAALEADHQVSPIPGASAPVASLVVSGLPTDAFIFIGYLPRRAAERRNLLASLAVERRTMIAFEAPHRLLGSLKEMEAQFGAQRRIAACRELTKLHEEILRGSLAEILAHFQSTKPRGEFTLVVAGKPLDERWLEPAVRKQLRIFLDQGLKPSDAARQVAAQSRWSRQEVYRLTLEK